MLTFLEVNGIHIDCINDEVAHVALSIASGHIDYEALFSRVKDHRI